MVSPCWIDALDQAMAAGLAGAILTFNTADRVFEGDPEPRAMSLKYFLAARFHGLGYDVGYFALSTGFTELLPPGVERREETPFDPALSGVRSARDVLGAVGDLLRQPDRRCVVIIDYADHVIPGPGPGGSGAQAETLALSEMLHAWSLDDNIRRSDSFVILISLEGGLSPLVRDLGAYRLITLDLPDEVARCGFIDLLVASRQRTPSARVGEIGPGLSPKDLARLTGGLRLTDIEELFHQAYASGTAISRSAVREKKKHSIEQICHDLVEVVEPTEGFEAVAGADHAKEYFMAVKPLWERGAAGIPQGILLAGVPGSGKSFLVKALAKEFGCPCLVMRNLRAMWVGESERNLERVLQVARNLAPVIVWTDEVDQNGGGQRSAGVSGDSGVNERMLARLLEFFGTAETRGRILWVATTNRPDLLDVAICDRFTVVIPFLHPTARERAALFPVLARQVGRYLAPTVDCARLARLSGLELLSVRALQEILVWAGTRADMAAPGTGNPPITEALLEEAIEDYQADLDPVEHQKIALTALRMTRFGRLLPWNRLSGYQREVAEWPPYVDGLVDPATGILDRQALLERLQALPAGGEGAL